MGSNKTVLDVIDYPSIADKPFVQIYAGVGSGKSYFAERFITGDEEHGIPKKTVLIITSRKAKVQQTLSEDALDIKGTEAIWNHYHFDVAEDMDDEEIKRYEIVLEDDWGEHWLVQKSVICTNAFIQRYLETKYYPENITTHLWELFDIIIVDEVHSVMADATYQTAPYYVKALVNETLRRQKDSSTKPPRCQQIILMTGTPEAIENFGTPENSVKLDYRKVCRNVQPKQVRFVPVDKTKRLVQQQIAAGGKTIYFSNHSKNLDSFDSEKASIPKDMVAVSFSDEKKRAALSKSEQERMQWVENTISEDSRLPDEIKLFISTSRNKEGINIDNEDIQCMYVESQEAGEIIQMAGRIRNGVDTLYLVQGAAGHRDREWRYEWEFAKYVGNEAPENGSLLVDACNAYLEHLCDKLQIEGLYGKGADAQTAVYHHAEIKTCIKAITEKSPYIVYDYFKNKFVYYHLRRKARKYYRESLNRYQQAAERGTLSSLVKKWFPDAEIIEEATPEYRSRKILDQVLADHPDGILTGVEREELIDKLHKIWEMVSLNPMLKRFCDYEVQPRSKSPTDDKYGTYCIRKRGEK